MGSNSVAVTKASDILSVLSKEFLDTEATTESRFTQKSVCDMIRTYSSGKKVTLHIVLVIILQESELACIILYI